MIAVENTRWLPVMICILPKGQGILPRVMIQLKDQLLLAERLIPHALLPSKLKPFLDEINAITTTTPPI
ncbi:hypothetical protein CKAN_01557800 [Cinnamomum micranthum f. kanehirae]|uniref:Uncharacterized protein n=1 Tax=Cinnamomum micranthum f. kanehirae TaxID=337451 RepID=A0A3S3MV09_9MAGN|nr:hypothetical protein CKAN_01557800 [Cinnamomum micranthum f. kanehirae]